MAQIRCFDDRRLKFNLLKCSRPQITINCVVVSRQLRSKKVKKLRVLQVENFLNTTTGGKKIHAKKNSTLV